MKRLGWILFFVAVIYFIFLIRQDIIDSLELKKEKEATSRAFDQGERTAEILQDRLGRLKSDDLIEELARTRLGLIKKGETAYKVIL